MGFCSSADVLCVVTLVHKCSHKTTPIPTSQGLKFIEAVLVEDIHWANFWKYILCYTLYYQSVSRSQQPKITDLMVDVCLTDNITVKHIDCAGFQ